MPGLIVLLTGAFIASLWPSFQGSGGAVVGVGDDAPEFNLTSDAGKPIQLSDFRGKFVILNFWASWCAPCVEEMPSLERFAEQFSPKGVVVLGVSVDEDRGAYQQFLRRVGVQFLTVRDPEKKTSRRYGTLKYPETYFIDPKGRVVQKVIGKADWTDPQILDYMEQLLKG